jgi:NAD(P)H-nitrite reductase large subunit
LGRTKRQLIIGNSAAAISAIRGIREKDESCSITLVSAEKCNAYSPVLTPYYISRKIPKKNLFFVNHKFYRDHRVKKVLGKKAVAIDPFRKEVYLEDHSRMEYDHLLIATGASPILPGPIKTGMHQHVAILRTINDADKIVALSKKAQEILIVGAGLIGLQVANAIFRPGVKLTIVESAKHILPEKIDADCAALLRRRLENQGISFLFKKAIKGFKKTGKNICAVTQEGELLWANLIVVGIGVKPNTELAINGGGIDVKKGIIVNDFMKTNSENIFAAGDVTEGVHLISGQKQVIATWTNACAQGRVAGLNMAGYPTRYEGGINENIINVFGITVASLGLTNIKKSYGEELKYYDPSREIYRKILLEGNRIVGAILLGKSEDSGLILNFIQNRVDISKWKERIARVPLGAGKVLFSLW